MRRLFTDEQEEFIKENYKNFDSYEEIASELLGLGVEVTGYQVKGWCNNNGLKKLGRVADEELICLILRYYLEGYSAQYIADVYNNKVTGKQVQDLAYRLGIRKSKKYSVDSDVFKKIDSNEKAYILGYIYADGSLYARMYEDGETYKSVWLEICCKKDDIELLESVKIVLNSEAPIRNKTVKGRVYKKLVIHNTDLCKDLIAMGCLPNKSLILEPPSEKYLPSVYIFDFIRGYLDGDGNVFFGRYANTRGWITTTASVGFVGTRSMLVWIQKHFNVSYAISPKGNVFQTRLASFPTFVRIYEKLYYQDCMCLMRKRKDYEYGLDQLKKWGQI